VILRNDVEAGREVNRRRGANARLTLYDEPTAEMCG
jgi:hypothetical protein